MLSKRAFSVLALDTVTRMSLDIANTFNTNIHRYRAQSLSPNNMQIYFRGAQEHINLSQDEDSVDWHDKIDRARRSLKYFTARWRIAGVFNLRKCILSLLY